MILGQQGGYTKFPCFKCYWDSRDKKNHWKKKCKKRELVKGQKNVVHENLVAKEDILLPPLHIKLGIMTQFVKALPKDGDTYLYLSEIFPGLSEAKIKAGIFNGPDIRRLMKDANFITKMTNKEKSAWVSFKDVVNNFLGNYKHPDYKNIVKKMLKNLRSINVSVSYKLHFLNAHLDDFPENLGAVSEEQGERFHQDIKIMEKRYQGRWDVNMMADYCWMLKRDTNRGENRIGLKRSFIN